MAGSQGGISGTPSALTPRFVGGQMPEHRYENTIEKKKKKRNHLFPLFEARSPERALAKKGILFGGL